MDKYLINDEKLKVLEIWYDRNNLGNKEVIYKKVRHISSPKEFRNGGIILNGGILFLFTSILGTLFSLNCMTNLGSPTLDRIFGTFVILFLLGCGMAVIGYCKKWESTAVVSYEISEEDLPKIQ